MVFRPACIVLVSALLVTLAGPSLSAAESVAESVAKSPAEGGAAAAMLHISFEKLEARRGVLMLRLAQTEAQFDGDAPPVLRMAVDTRHLTAEGIILPVPPGRYALSVYQDFNGNGALDKNRIGLPTEPFGFLNNPTIIMGRPGFETCARDFPPGQTHIRIEMKAF